VEEEKERTLLKKKKKKKKKKEKKGKEIYTQHHQLRMKKYLICVREGGNEKRN